MIMLDRLIAGTSGMTRNVRMLSPSPRISTGPGCRTGGATVVGKGSTGRVAGAPNGAGLPVGKSGIGASIGAPGMGLRVNAAPRDGSSARPDPAQSPAPPDTLPLLAPAES